VIGISGGRIFKEAKVHKGLYSHRKKKITLIVKLLKQLKVL
jgi:uncharacterized protein YajQ (UPF0234 family)